MIQSPIRSNLAPIVLFVYNRPWHTRQTLESLMSNVLADESDLYIYADGPKEGESEESTKGINEVREVIRTRQWCRSVGIIESEINLGLANSIIAGVTRVVSEYGRVIVLEDDLVTSPFFLDYMNRALIKYQDGGEVMQICGYMLPINPARLKETFFLRLTSSWGWATWARAWKYFEPNVEILRCNLSDDKKNKFNLDGAYDYYSLFRQQQEKRIDSWAIRWYASVFLHNGLCLHPSKSLILNNGNDDSGVHSQRTDLYDTTLLSKRIDYYENDIHEDQKALQRIIRYYKAASGHIVNKSGLMEEILRRFRIVRNSA